MPPKAAPRLVASPRPETAESAAIMTHAEAMRAVAKAIDRAADEFKAAREQREPADRFWAEASERLDKLCQWLRKRGPWIIGAIPGALVAVQAISPSAAKALAALLTAAGAQ